MLKVLLTRLTFSRFFVIIWICLFMHLQPGPLHTPEFFFFSWRTFALQLSKHFFFLGQTSESSRAFVLLASILPSLRVNKNALMLLPVQSHASPRCRPKRSTRAGFCPVLAWSGRDSKGNPTADTAEIITCIF